MALSIYPNRTVASVLNIYRFMCPMPTISNISEKSYCRSVNIMVDCDSVTVVDSLSCL